MPRIKRTDYLGRRPEYTPPAPPDTPFAPLDRWTRMHSAAADIGAWETPMPVDALHVTDPSMRHHRAISSGLASLLCRRTPALREQMAIAPRLVNRNDFNSRLLAAVGADNMNLSVATDRLADAARQLGAHFTAAQAAFAASMPLARAHFQALREADEARARSRILTVDLAAPGADITCVSLVGSDGNVLDSFDVKPRSALPQPFPNASLLPYRGQALPRIDHNTHNYYLARAHHGRERPAPSSALVRFINRALSD